MDDENKFSYYYIVQKVKNFTYSNMIVEPASIKDIKKLVSCLVGNISVYLYKEDNSYIDCKFHSHVSTCFTFMFPLVSQTCFHPFHSKFPLGSRV